MNTLRTILAVPRTPFGVQSAQHPRRRVGPVKVRPRGVATLILILFATACSGGPETVLTRGNIYRGNLDSSDEYWRGSERFFDTWVMTVDAKQRVSIGMESDNFDAFLLVFREGSEVARNDDGGEGSDARVEFRASNAGEYVVIATSYDDNERGSYRLRWHSDGSPVFGSVAPEGDLTGGGTFSGRLTSSDPLTPYRFFPRSSHFDLWTLTVRPDEPVAIEMEFDDAFLVVFREGIEIARDRFGGEGSDARVELSNAGEYVVMASNNFAGPLGSYRLSLSGNLSPTGDSGGVLTPESTFYGSLSTVDPIDGSGSYRLGSRYDWWLLSAGREESVTIDMASDDFDALLVVFREGIEIARNDDGGPGSDARVEFRASNAGEYVVIATSYDDYQEGGVGSYRLTRRGEPGTVRIYHGPNFPLVVPAGMLTTGSVVRSVVNGRLDSSDPVQRWEINGYFDVWILTAEAGQNVVLDLDSDDMDDDELWLRLMTYDDGVLAEWFGVLGELHNMPFRVPSAGDYFVLVGSSGPIIGGPPRPTGSYRLGLVMREPETPELP